jgi:hypothetical protein
MPVKSHKVSRNAGKRPPDRLGDFRAWLADRFSEPEHIYHRGVLAADRAKDEELNRLAEAVFAWIMSSAGSVIRSVSRSMVRRGRKSSRCVAATTWWVCVCALPRRRSP